MYSEMSSLNEAAGSNERMDEQRYLKPHRLAEFRKSLRSQTVDIAREETISLCILFGINIRPEYFEPPGYAGPFG
jgi:hypothetical protein